MDLVSLLGVVGIFTGLARPLPQLVRLLRTGDAHGVSLDTAATSCIVSSAWATYGILAGLGAVALASGLSGGVFLLIALLALRRGRHVRELRAAPIWLLIVVVAVALAGATGLGVVLVVGALVANLPQVIVAFRELDLSGLSPTTWALTASDGAIWFLYGFATGDMPILVNNFFQLITSLTIVVRRRLWQRRVVRAGVSRDYVTAPIRGEAARSSDHAAE